MTNINIRVDDTLKNEVENVLKELGLTTSEAVRLFLNQVKICNGLPFNLSLYPNAETRKVIDDARQGIGLSGLYNTPDEMWKDLGL